LVAALLVARSQLGTTSAEEVVMVSEDGTGVSYVFPIHLSEHDRAYLRMVIGAGNRLLDFALTQQIWMAGGWRDVVRYDCSHGGVHVHRFRRRRTGSVIREVCDLDDIDRGYDTAVADILGNWEEHRRRYLHG
jgi:hypothetical protein